MLKSLWRETALAAISLLFASQSFAAIVQPQWYEGWWNCKIDGRPSQIVWETRVVPVTTCSGDICSSSYRVDTLGWFREQDSAWVKLVKNSSTSFDMKFTYTGDNTPWYLAYNSSTRSAIGHTTWQGKRYPLSCSKS